MPKETNKVSELLHKTHAQVGRSSEESKIQYAIKNAGISGWFAASLGKLGVKDFRSIVEGKNLLKQKNIEKK